MTANAPAAVAAQYASDEHLQTRIRTHQQYSVGRDLEAVIDDALALAGDERLLDVGTGPGHFPARLRASGHTGELVGVDLSAGMVATAQARHRDVTYLQAAADAVPFDDGAFEVLSARHMLYHVPDVLAALREFRRVLQPGGRFLAVTNTAGYMAGLWDVVTQAATTEPLLLPLAGSRASFAAAFSEENGGAWVQEVFGHAALTLSDSELVFPDAAPALAYLRSTLEGQQLGEHWPAAEAALRAAMAPQFRKGPWRISKRVALISAVR